MAGAWRGGAGGVQAGEVVGSQGVAQAPCSSWDSEARWRKRGPRAPLAAGLCPLRAGNRLLWGRAGRLCVWERLWGCVSRQSRALRKGLPGSEWSEAVFWESPARPHAPFPPACPPPRLPPPRRALPHDVPSPQASRALHALLGPSLSPSPPLPVPVAEALVLTGAQVPACPGSSPHRPPIQLPPPACPSSASSR